MADLDVAMRLSMQYSPAGAQAAEADLKRVATAAGEINTVAGKTANPLKATAQATKEVGNAAETAGKKLSFFQEVSAAFKSGYNDPYGTMAAERIARQKQQLRTKPLSWRPGYSVTGGLVHKTGEPPPEPGAGLRRRDAEAAAASSSQKKRTGRAGISPWRRGMAMSAARGAGFSGVGGVGMIGALRGALMSPIGIAASVGYGGYALLQKLAQSSRDFRGDLEGLQRATRGSGKEMDHYRTSILRMARETGKGRKEITQLMTATARFSGGPKDGLEEFAGYALKTSRVWRESAAEIGKGFSVIATAWKADAGRIEEIGNAIGALAESAKVAETELLEMASTDARRNARIGFSAEQVAAWGAALRETGSDTQAAASAFAALRDSLETAREGGKEFQAGLKALGLSSKAVERGMQKDASATMLTVLKLAAKIKDPQKQYKVLKALVGESNADAFTDLIAQIGKVSEKLGIAADQAGNATKAVEALNNVQNQPGAKWDALKEELRQDVGDPVSEWADRRVEKMSGGTLKWIERQKQGIEEQRRKNTETQRRFALQARQEQLDADGRTVQEWTQLNQYRADMENDVANGSWFKRFFSGRQLDRLHELDAEVAKIHQRLSEDQARSGMSNAFGLNGPNLGNTVMTLPDAARDAMHQYGAVVTKEGQIAIRAAGDIAAQIRSMLSFDAKISITPVLSAPGVAAPVTSSPSKPKRGATGARNITIGSVTVSGVRDVASLTREISRAADRKAKDQRDNALHETGAFA